MSGTIQRPLLESDIKETKVFIDREKSKVDCLHWGQRKLLLAETEFLSQYLTSDIERVVYAGAAPGHHITVLTKLFPRAQFDLYDPGKFDIKSSDRVRLYNVEFCDAIAKGYAQARCLFISDVRSDVESKEFEQAVQRNMQAQMRWHELMKPVKSLLKFRLPWDTGKTEYLQGSCRLQAWTPVNSTETRLLVDQKADRCLYDNAIYEGHMCHFQQSMRCAKWMRPAEVKDIAETVSGFDGCFDCVHDYEVWKRYCSEVSNTQTPADLMNWTALESVKRFKNKSVHIESGKWTIIHATNI